MQKENLDVAKPECWIKNFPSVYEIWAEKFENIEIKRNDINCESCFNAKSIFFFQIPSNRYERDDTKHFLLKPFRMISIAL